MEGGDDADVLVGSAADDFMVGGAGPTGSCSARSGGTTPSPDFEDGVELIDLSGSGLSFEDLTIFDEFGFGETTIEFERRPDRASRAWPSRT